MWFQKCGCCSNTLNETVVISTNEPSNCGVHNSIYETWEPVTQQKTSSASVEDQPKLSKSSRSSFGSMKLSKIDLNLNIFENNRFTDISEMIHKSNANLDKI